MKFLKNETQKFYSGGFWLGGLCLGVFCLGGFCPGVFCPDTFFTGFNAVAPGFTINHPEILQ